MAAFVFLRERTCILALSFSRTLSMSSRSPDLLVEASGTTMLSGVWLVRATSRIWQTRVNKVSDHVGGERVNDSKTPMLDFEKFRFVGLEVSGSTCINTVLASTRTSR